MTLSLNAADRAHVVDHDRIALSGSAAELAEDPSVKRAYLGEDAEVGAIVADAARVDHAGSRIEIPS
jgi:hypothetical protein